ncbi:hypothetical protein D5086_009198 [Populus alba]|uniref:Uncharacterized protein n=1 Tax=Populus alba TaxID=43335 RepID=A0ACC4CJ85_POPAL
MSNPERIEEKNAAAKTPAQHVLHLLPHFTCNRSNSDSVESCKFSSLNYTQYLIHCFLQCRYENLDMKH